LIIAPAGGHLQQESVPQTRSIPFTRIGPRCFSTLAMAAIELLSL